MNSILVAPHSENCVMAEWLKRSAGLVALLIACAPDGMGHAEKPRPVMSPKAKTLLTQIGKAYSKLKAYGDDGEVTVSGTAGRTTGRLVRKMPLQFVRPDRFALDLGALAVVSAPKTLVVYDFTRRTYFRRKFDTPPTADATRLTADQKERDSLLVNAGTAFAEAEGIDQMVGAVGAPMVSVLLAVLLDGDPVRSVAQGALRVTVESGAPRQLRVEYPKGIVLRLSVSADSSLIDRMDLLIPEVKGVRVEWRAGKVSTNKADVQRQLDAQAKALAERARKEGFAETRPMGTPPTWSPLVPKPPRTKTLFELLRKLFG